MVLDALRAYLQLASGVTEESRQRAVAAARSVLAQTPSVDTGATGQLQQQVAALAEDLVVTSRANRELLLGLIRTEVERTLSRLGIASADEVDTLRRSVERLERLIREQRSPTGDAAAARPAPRKRVTTKTAAAAPSTSTKAGSVTKTAGATVESGMERPRARRASRPAESAASTGPARRAAAAAPKKSAAETRTAKTPTSETKTSETPTSETPTSEDTT